MANVEINDLTAKTTPDETDEIEIQETAGGTSKKITRANFIPDASTTAKGKVELATTGETTTGTDTERATTPAGVKAVADTKANTSHTHAAADVTSGLLASGRIATGTPDGTKFLRDDQSWQALPGGGDMLASTYDPQAVGDDAFDTDNHTDGITNKVYTATEKTKLAGIETAADVTDAANVDAAGATMNTDSTLAGNGYFLDEDDMVSNSATKVPSQQSVKAYVDAEVAGAGGGTVDTVVAGTNIDVDATDPANPIVSVESLTAADITDLTATATELNYTDGVTSAIQTQLNTKAADADVVHDTGDETIAGVKTFSSDPLIPDEAYGSGWNGVLEPPTKNAVYDKIETLSAGGSAYVPTVRFYLGGGIGEGASNGGYNEKTNSGTASALTYKTAGGIELNAGSTNSGYARFLVRDQITHEQSTNLSASFWSRKYYGGAAIASLDKDTNSNKNFFFGIGDVQSGYSALSGAVKACGLMVEIRGTSITYYIFTNDGTNVTKTSISTAVNAISNPPNWNNVAVANLWGFEFIPTTSFKIYCDATLVGTVSSNLPSGSMVNDYLGGILYDATTSNSLANYTRVNHGFIEMTVW